MILNVYGMFTPPLFPYLDANYVTRSTTNGFGGKGKSNFYLKAFSGHHSIVPYCHTSELSERRQRVPAAWG